jgi:arylsulfatase
MQTKLILCALISLLAVAALAQNAPAADGQKPNIVFILVFILMDNLGYGEVGSYGGGILRGAPTPRIDKLASEGMRLLNFNVEAQCTPEPLGHHARALFHPFRHAFDPDRRRA